MTTGQSIIGSQCCVYRDFLDFDTRAELLTWALQNEAKFKPTLVGTQGKGGKHDPTQRISLAVREFGPIKSLLHRRMLNLAAEVIRDLSVKYFVPSDIELELVASNDGAFFKSHVDTFYGEGRAGGDRLVSAVYYFHKEPKGFAGGALRIHPMLDSGGDSFEDVQPEQNTLVAFPSWAYHEVLPVSCPSRRFCDSRFSVNLWILREIKVAN